MPGSGYRARRRTRAATPPDRYRWRSPLGPPNRRDDPRRRCGGGLRGRLGPEYHRIMSYLPRLDAATTACWPDLIDELDRWQEAERVAGLWWRDDDAAAATPQLDALLRLAEGAPLALAVISGLVEPSLPVALERKPDLAVLQHVWPHA